MSEIREILAVLILGSNIEPELHLPQAVQDLAKTFRVMKVSNVWESLAVGSRGPKFLNAGMLVETDFDPDKIKHQVLRPLEARLGRVRTTDKFASRSIDIDLIAWGSEICDPLVWEFAHLAVPAAELLPDLRSIKTGETLGAAAARLKLKSQICQRPDVRLMGGFLPAGNQPAAKTQ